MDGLHRLAGMHRIAGLAVAVFGLLAALSWLEPLLPGVYLTGPHAGIGLVLAGLAVVAAAATRRALRLAAVLLAILLVADGGLGLVAIHGGVALPEWPGRLSLASSLAFMFAGIALAGLALARPLLSQLATLAVLALALMNILGFLLGEGTVGLGLSDGRVQPVTTSLVLIVLSAAMAGVGLRRGAWCAFYRDRDDRRLTMMGVGIVLLSSLCVGVAGVNLTARAMLKAYDEALLARLIDHASRIDRGLAQVRTDLEITLDRILAGEAPADGAALLARYHSPDNLSLPSALIAQREGGGHWAFGIPVREGHRLATEWEGVSLLWDESPKLVVTRPLRYRDGRSGSLSAVLELSSTHVGLFVPATFGRTGETLYCARINGRSHCLPSRFSRAAFVAPASVRGAPIPITRALDGETGVSIAADYRAVQVKAAHMSLGRGLAIVEKVDLDELMEPALRWLWMAVWVIGAFTALGGLALYRAAFPLAQALRLQQRKYQAILDHAPSALVTAAADGRVELLNSQAEALFMLSPEAAVKRLLSSFFEDESVGAFLRDSVVGSSHQVRCMARRSDGHPLLADVRLTCVEIDGQRLVIAAVDDCTDQATREQELECWERVFMSASSGIALGDADGIFLKDLNPAFARMHGYAREALIGRPIVEVFAPSVRQGMAAHIARAHEAGQHCFDSVHLRKDGSEFPVRVTVIVVYRPDGRVNFRIVNVQDISRQYEMEGQLRESEQMRRLVLDTQRDMICRWRPDSTLVYANRACAEMYGETQDNMVGKRWDGLMREQVATPEALREFEARLQDLAAHPRRMELTVPMRHPVAGRIWVQWSMLPLYREGRVLDGFQVSGHDVTARKAAESALVESENWFRALFDSLFHYAALLDVEGRFLALNRRSVEFLGLASTEVVGVPIWEMGAATQVDGTPEVLRQGVARAAAGESVRFELQAMDRNGQRVFHEFSMRPIPGEDGRIDHVIAEAHDITEYRRQQRSIEERDARFQGMAESMPGIALEFLREAGGGIRVLYVNRSVHALCGVGAEELESGDHAILDCLHPDDREAFLAAVADSERHLGELAWVGRLVGERDSWVSLRAIPRRIDGQVVWSGVGVDITGMKEKELEIEHSRTALRELATHYEMVREDERRHMAREVHDELGQNLTALRMGLAVLGERAEDAQLVGESRRLKGLVDQSISVVRGIATTLRPAAMDLGIVAALRWLSGEFEVNVGLPCLVDVDAGVAIADDDRATGLFRIVQESLTNIARHAAATHVWIRLRRINRHLVLEVGDDGCGFDTTQDSGGFGLLGMRERALSLGGEMTVCSKPGEGTVVSVHIPVN
ncbi:PAS domain S-box protein [Zoogloea sp.]|uniref:PAS domain-containing sensor histidine kinase n=1 Tax=Zoogloea sp. TaxID=49181 RepID=UPI001416A392|nr:MAG: PAS domain S-box protein [Zoogloea sp.]